MLETPLNPYHRQLGARLVEFAGWEMPVVFRGIRQEHRYTRQHGSFFDVSHMGRIEFRGAEAQALLGRLSTRDIGKLRVGQCGYSHLCRQDGGVLDDVVVSRCDDHFLVVCNAANRTKLLGWFERQRRGWDVEIRDRTLDTAMVAIQGPEVMETMTSLLPLPLDGLKRYHFTTGQLMGSACFVARSGYTGEDGVEIILPARVARAALQMLVTGSQELGRPLRPAGLGARDTLRLEAGMPLYGHELSEQWDSISAGQGWCVDLGRDFVGRDALRAVQASGPKRRIAGFELTGRRIARQGTRILHGGADIGFVTSGTLSPTFEKVIAMGLIEASCCAPGTQVEMDLHGTRVGARVVPLPFYRRPRK